MDLITIAGTPVTPNPSEYNVNIMDIVEATRNGNGTLIVDRKAIKRKIELGWKFLTASEWSVILNLLSDFQFSVLYFDPQENDFLTKTFYVSDRNSPMFRIRDGVVVGYTGIKISLVEI